ncbi:hypothetical protein K0M31_010497 [Melipona bicolor]|uniref:Uncharacterized protein n=1 Tax=Melipona bicolor TaxID=60889 RepID=A0AA40KI40_9HYME|nr:hypothetical protein K0M31_010497 [Melipona bicolor]
MKRGIAIGHEQSSGELGPEPKTTRAFFKLTENPEIRTGKRSRKRPRDLRFNLTKLSFGRSLLDRGSLWKSMGNLKVAKSADYIPSVTVSSTFVYLVRNFKFGPIKNPRANNIKLENM